MKKKGSLIDLSIMIFLLLGAALIFLIGFIIYDNVNTNFQGMSDNVITSDAKTASTKINNLYTGAIDNTFLFFAIGLAVIVLFLASMVRFSPIFIPFFIIGLVILVFFSGIASNIYQKIALNTSVADYANQLVNISTILTYLPWIIGIFGTILMVVSYNKYREVSS